jgi:vacuolar protein sorting-associated protein 26
LQKNIIGFVQGATCRADIDFKDEKGHRYKKTAVVKGKNNETEELPLYTTNDSIFGEVCLTMLLRFLFHAMREALGGLWLQVRITPLTTKRVEHSGIKVQLLGQIELASERGQYHDFVSLGKSQRDLISVLPSSR